MRMLGSARALALSYLSVELLLKNSSLCDHGTQTLQTDRQTAYCRIAVLYVASRGKTSTNKNL